MTAHASTSFQVADVAAPEHPYQEAAPESVPTDGTTEVVGHEEGGHAKAGLPQLDTTTFAGQVFWLLLSLAAMYLVVSRLAVPKVGGVLEDRRNRIKGDLDQAAQAKASSEAAIANYEKALADARARAAKLSDEIRNRVQAEANARSDAASRDLAAQATKAEARINELRANAMAKIGTIARETAAEIVQKLTGEAAAATELDAAINGALKRS